MGSMGLIIETLVSVLLAVTIGYCILLNRRLKAMRTDEAAMRQTVGELVGATEAAERAVAGLKRTVAEQEAALSNRLFEAESVTRDLDASVADGEDIIRRLTMITAAARPSRPPPAPAANDATDEPAARDEAPPVPVRNRRANELAADLRRLRRGAA